MLVSSVIRSSHQGDSHGGVYLIDLEADRVKQVLDWDRSSIDWEGRGGDRGLRGIAYDEDKILLAASDEVFLYDRRFRLLRSFRNPYLKHCHEIAVSGRALYLTSTRFDSVLVYDLAQEAFTIGYCLRLTPVRRVLAKGGMPPRPRLWTFDPNGTGGPSPGDTCHLNSVSVVGDTVFVAGTRLRNVYAIRAGKLGRYGRIPLGSHNAQPYRYGILLNHTATNRICLISRRGRVIQSWPIPEYSHKDLSGKGVPRDHARQAFARGLATSGGELIVGGSSPATISAYQLGRPAAVKTVNLSMDVRNAVHGLEIWPFGY